MSLFDNRYYYLNKLLLSIIGQWPYQSRLNGNAMFAITLFFTGSLTALEFWGLIAGITNLSIIMENTSPLLVNSLIFIKMINYLCNKYKMRDLLDRIEETWKELQEGTGNEILRHYGEQSRVLTIKYMLALYAVWILYTVPPLAVSGIYSLLPMNKTYTARFLYRLEHVLDMDKYFNLLMFHGFLSVFYIVSVVVAIDSMFVAYVQHACALFEVIRCNMERIRGSNFVALRPAVADDEAYRAIIGCIESHKRALKFSELLESAFATSYLFLLGNVIICLSFSAAELIMVDNQFDEIVRITSASLAQVVHIYFLSLVCQRLLDHSGALHGAMYANSLTGGIDYSCNWYAISLRSRQLLKFMLLRTTKPCLIKAGKMYVMSMEGFSSILHVSVSYFTMLTSLQ